MPRYQIEVSEDQLAMLITATELLARMGMAQFTDVADYAPGAHSDRKTPEAHINLKVALRHAEEVAKQGLSGSPGIAHDDVPMTSKRAWDMYQVLRHRLSWDRAGNPSERDWKTMSGVSFDDPMTKTGEPFAKIETIQG